MSGLITVGYFLFTLFFNLVVFLLWARIALRYFRVSTLNPVSQSIQKLTSPFLGSLKNLDANKRRLPRYDWVCFGALILIELLKFLGIDLLFMASKLPWTLIPLYALADLVIQPCNLMFYAILIRVIMSWVNPRGQHPVMDLLGLVTDPLLHLGRLIIPDISGFDFSPYIMLIILEVITLFIGSCLPYHIV